MAETLDELLIEELRDLLDAEQQITKALPKLARAAESDELRSAFEMHLQETQGQIDRLEQVFSSLGHPARKKTCEGVRGLIEEGSTLMKELDRGPVRDAALIAAAQKVEHYEIAAYGTVRTFANLLGHDDVAGLIQQTLDEESATDKKLTGIAEGINVEALEEGSEGETEEGIFGRMAGGSRQMARRSTRSTGRAAERTRGGGSTRRRSASTRGGAKSRSSSRGARKK